MRFFTDVEIEGKDVLDIGCASGALAASLARYGFQWHSYKGIDICADFVDDFNHRNLPSVLPGISNWGRIPFTKSEPTLSTFPFPSLKSSSTSTGSPR
jgi:SAM-dependent methyltransferase